MIAIEQHEKEAGILNLPNKLTILRILLVPFIIAAMLISFPFNYLAAGLLFGIRYGDRVIRKLNLDPPTDPLPVLMYHQVVPDGVDRPPLIGLELDEEGESLQHDGAVPEGHGLSQLVHGVGLQISDPPFRQHMCEIEERIQISTR